MSSKAPFTTHQRGMIKMLRRRYKEGKTAPLDTQRLADFTQEEVQATCHARVSISLHRARDVAKQLVRRGYLEEHGVPFGPKTYSLTEEGRTGWVG